MSTERLPQSPESSIGIAQEAIVRNVEEYGSIYAYVRAVLNELTDDHEGQRDISKLLASCHYISAGLEQYSRDDMTDLFYGALLAVDYMRHIADSDIMPGAIAREAIETHTETTRREVYPNTPSHSQDQLHSKTALRIQFINSNLNPEALPPEHEALLAKLVIRKELWYNELALGDTATDDTDYPHQFGVGFRFMLHEALQSGVTITETPRATTSPVPEGWDAAPTSEVLEPHYRREPINNLMHTLATQVMQLQASDSRLSGDVDVETLDRAHRRYEGALDMYIQLNELLTEGEHLAFEGNMHIGVATTEAPEVTFAPFNADHTLAGFYEGISVLRAPSASFNTDEFRYHESGDANDPTNHALAVPCIVLSSIIMTNKRMAALQSNLADELLPENSKIYVPLIYKGVSGYRQTFEV